MAAMQRAPRHPGFHYFDQARQTDVTFRRLATRRAEAAQAADRRHPGQRRRLRMRVHGRRRQQLVQLRPPHASDRTQPACRSVCRGGELVFVKNTARTVYELVRAGLRFIADPGGAARGWSWLTIQLGISVWIRGFFTLGASRDLYAGAPAVYVNYLDYDVAAHAFGPRSRRALKSLRRVDRAIHQLWRVLRRVPEHQYDLYILSDHGQALCTPYRDLTGGQRLERWIVDTLVAPTAARTADPRPRTGLARGIRSRRREVGGLFQRFLNYLDEDFLRQDEAEAHEAGSVRVIAAGPNAFLYVLGVAGRRRRRP
jgi:hypothetical protein